MSGCRWTGRGPSRDERGELSMGRLLHYVHDPMCSWCWAFRPVWQEIVRQLPPDVAPRRLLGGLAPDSAEPMPAAMQAHLRGVGLTIQQRVPGTRFNFGFWELCRPRRSTYPACRAVIAARDQGEEFAEPMILAVQQAYYLHARNPSDFQTLVELAGEIGVDQPCFREALDAPRTHNRLLQEIRQGQRMGAQGFPSLVLEHEGRYQLLSYDYLDAGVVLAQL